MNTSRIIPLVLVGLSLFTPGMAAASTEAELARNVLLWARPGATPFEDDQAGPRFDVPFEARLGLYSGAMATISFVELGEKSPLRQKIGETAWNQLKERLPLVQQGADSLLPGLVIDLEAELEKPSLDRQTELSLAAGAMLLTASDSGDLFAKGTLIYGARAFCALVLHPTVFARLTLIAVDRNHPLSGRAGQLVTAGSVLKAQLYLAEARYKYEIEAGTSKPSWLSRLIAMIFVTR